MSELFRSAFNNFSSNWSIGGASDGGGQNNDSSNDNQFVGQNVDLNGQRLRVERVIAEGGFGFVFKVRDLQSAAIYALKRLIAADDDAKEEIENEINILTQLQPHPHVMQFVSWGRINNNIYLLLSEYCGCGSLKDVSLPITNHQQLHRIIYQLCSAIQQMHKLSIIHRDLKIENVLFDNNGYVKLCDFGSATVKSYNPDHNWTPIQRSLLEDEMCRHTTPMYRPPEILDTYLHYPINIAMDIWAFGCMIFTIKFGRHPFEDSAKLRIINCNYSFPPNVSETDVIVQIIRSCLKVDPNERPLIADIMKLLEANFVDLSAPCVSPRQSTPTQPSQPQVSPIQQSVNPPGTAQPISQQGFSLSGFTRYIKDTSSKVMQTVQQSIARQDLDLSYITSRFIVMSYPAEGLESTYRNHIEDVRAFLDTRHPSYIVVNVSGRSYGTTKFGNHIKVFDGGPSWKDPKRPPTLTSILSLCQVIHRWMNGGEKNVTVIHCTDGKVNSSILSVALLVWIGLFSDFNSALNMFAVKRIPVDLFASHKRYLSYITDIGGGRSKLPLPLNDSIVVIKSIVMIGIPLFTKLRDGCRPFIEIFMNGDMRIASTATDYERMRSYNRANDTRVVWKDLAVQCDSKADLSIVASHARSTLGSKMLQGKMTAIRVCSVQFNLIHETRGEIGPHIIKFNINELDSIEESDRFPRDFQIIIEIEVIPGNSEERMTKHTAINNIESSYDPMCLFLNELEFEECRELFGAHNEPQRPTPKNDKPQRPPPPVSLVLTDNSSERHNNNALYKDTKDNIQPTNTSNFFDTLNWESDANINGSNNTKEFGYEETDNNAIKHTKKLSLSGTGELLLNLSLDDASEPLTTANERVKSSIPSDLFEIPQSVGDLLGDTSINAAPINSTHSPNINLLNEFIVTNGSENAHIPDVIHPKASPLSPTKTMADMLSPMQRNVSTPNLAKLDPLAELGSFLSTTAPTTKQNNSAIPKVSSYSGLPTLNGPKPNYSGIHFPDPLTNSAATGTGTTKVSGAEFEDLLGGFKKTQNDNYNKTIGQMKKAEMLKDGTIDPMRLKVMEWKENKTRNIRALLCSLNTIVWDGCHWQQIGMHQLINESDVKKMYRKACLAVHPDKLVGTEHEELAKLIFMELNDAWSEFEKQII